MAYAYLRIWMVSMATMRRESRPHRRGLHLHPARTPHQIEFEIDIFRRTERIGLGAHPDDAVAQPSLQRSERLPFQPIERIAGRMPLRHRRSGELLAPVV